MVSVKWCLKQKNGIELVEPKKHLVDSYLNKSMDDLKVCRNLEGDWKLITGYYACYNALYSVLMKCGIKCEIHDCSIEMMKLLDFSGEEINFMKKLKAMRIEVQYYLKKGKIEGELIKKFVVRCRKVLENLDDIKIEKIREGIKKHGC